MPSTYTGYIKGITAKSGKTPEEFYDLASQKGFIKKGKITATFAELLNWLKTDMGLGHVYANMIITYFRLCTDDPKLTPHMKDWAYRTGYQKGK